ncbi:spindlin interactor and repressor of chromatin-binding protein isoform X2 [Anolis carolinensis]|uniref:spindlin interactor and repressor of chromatin-binding protein isoform X2 n=1 Tax=Anolis carolinensis TaxID=28377 RepID=UPI002F2B4EAC
MALKAETPRLDYIKVSSSVLRFKEKGKEAADPVVTERTPVKRDGASVDPKDRGERRNPSVLAGAGQEEPSSSWKQEYLIAESPSHGRPVCMVCGGILSCSDPAAARKHILQQHAHSLDFSLEEKHNILEAWSEGAVLPTVAQDPSPEGKEWLSECGVPGSAPSEIRIFTDGTFPAGFTLKLYCRAQPETPQDSRVKPNTKKRTVVKLPYLTTSEDACHRCGRNVRREYFSNMATQPERHTTNLYIVLPKSLGVTSFCVPLIPSNYCCAAKLL